MGEVWVAPVGTDKFVSLGRTAGAVGLSFQGLTAATRAAAEVEREQFLDVLRGGSITMTVELTPSQAHEWRWWMVDMRHRMRRPRVHGPRPLAFGALPVSKRGRRR